MQKLDSIREPSTRNRQYPMSNVTLTPMTEAEYQVYLPRTIQEYAAENVRAGYWKPEEATAKSEKTFADLLPQGVNTPDNYIYTVRDAESGQSVGVIWINVTSKRVPPVAFIYEIRMDEDQRGKGYGKATMYAIEEESRRLGAKHIGLHVFGHNETAFALYQKVGYKVSSYNMDKEL